MRHIRVISVEASCIYRTDYAKQQRLHVLALEACHGPCHASRDVPRCCSVPAIQDAAVQLLRSAGAQGHVASRVAMGAASGTAPGGARALHFAALHGDLGALTALAASEEVNAVDDRGWAALHLAAGAGRAAAVELLVKARAAPEQRAPEGTASDIAVQSLPEGKASAVALALARHIRARRFFFSS